MRALLICAWWFAACQPAPPAASRDASPVDDAPHDDLPNATPDDLVEPRDQTSTDAHEEAVSNALDAASDGSATHDDGSFDGSASIDVRATLDVRPAEDLVLSDAPSGPCSWRVESVLNLPENEGAVECNFTSALARDEGVWAIETCLYPSAPSYWGVSMHRFAPDGSLLGSVPFYSGFGRGPGATFAIDASTDRVAVGLIVNGAVRTVLILGPTGAIESSVAVTPPTGAYTTNLVATRDGYSYLALVEGQFRAIQIDTSGRNTATQLLDIPEGSENIRYMGLPGGSIVTWDGHLETWVPRVRRVRRFNDDGSPATTTAAIFDEHAAPYSVMRVVAPTRDRLIALWSSVNAAGTPNVVVAPIASDGRPLEAPRALSSEIWSPSAAVAFGDVLVAAMTGSGSSRRLVLNVLDLDGFPRAAAMPIADAAVGLDGIPSSGRPEIVATPTGAIILFPGGGSRRARGFARLACDPRRDW